MVQAMRTIPISQIVLDEDIYPRKGVNPKRVTMFVQNITDGFEIDPIEIQVTPDKEDMYRILDGAHRFNAYKEIGATELAVRIIALGHQNAKKSTRMAFVNADWPLSEL